MDPILPLGALRVTSNELASTMPALIFLPSMWDHVLAPGSAGVAPFSSEKVVLIKMKNKKYFTRII